MTEPLETARTLAELLRFSGDRVRNRSSGHRSPADRVRATCRENSLRVDRFVTPSLARSLERACDNLQVPTDVIDVFVFASPHLQAECLASSTADCVVRVSSTLIEVLDDSEFQFVIGHELGHFLLGHGIANVEAQAGSLDYLLQSRAQEISVDRIGYHACGSLEATVRAMMKIASGLGSSHLRFDLGAFMSQLQEADQRDVQASAFSTHPSILVRCRALFWFSMLEVETSGASQYSIHDLQKVDERVRSDLDRFVDAPLLRIVSEAKENAKMWCSALEIVSDGVFSAEEQLQFGELFGARALAGLKGLLTDTPVNGVKDMIQTRVNLALTELREVSATAHDEVLGATMGMGQDEAPSNYFPPH
jgi:hypothetical protein